MSTGKAVTKFVRISPRKARLAAGIIRGLGVEEARAQLGVSNLRGGRILRKTLDSAIANAETNEGARREDLVVTEVRVDGGPTMKRARTRQRGGRSMILKRTSHLTVTVKAAG